MSAKNLVRQWDSLFKRTTNSLKYFCCQARGGLLPVSPVLELPPAPPPLSQQPHQLGEEGGQVVQGGAFLPRGTVHLPQPGGKGGTTFGDRVICDPPAPQAFQKANDHPQPLHLCCDGGLSHTRFILPCTVLPKPTNPLVSQHTSTFGLSWVSDTSPLPRTFQPRPISPLHAGSILWLQPDSCNLSPSAHPHPSPDTHTAPIHRVSVPPHHTYPSLLLLTLPLPPPFPHTVHLGGGAPPRGASPCSTSSPTVLPNIRTKRLLRRHKPSTRVVPQPRAPHPVLLPAAPQRGPQRTNPARGARPRSSPTSLP